MAAMALSLLVACSEEREAVDRESVIEKCRLELRTTKPDMKLTGASAEQDAEGLWTVEFEGRGSNETHYVASCQVTPVGDVIHTRVAS